MRSRDRKAAALATALLLATPGGFAQAASPVAWEVVPNATDAWDLSVAGDSTVYLTGGRGTWVWRRSGPDRFVEVNDRQIHERVTMTSNGRFFFVSDGLRMSKDYGRRALVAVERGEAVIETHSGALVAATDNLGVERSTDGGDSWTVIGRDDPLFQSVFGRAFAQSPPTPELPHGRLVVAGLGGAAVSTDDGLTWQSSNLTQFFGYDSEDVIYSGYQDAFYTYMNGPVEDGGSEKGVVRESTDGRTWTTRGRLPADIFGFVGRLAAGEDGSLWGSMDSGRDTTQFGAVYRSLDRGATWENVGQFDGEELVGDSFRMEDIVVDWEGRVWVGTSRTVLRAVEPVTSSAGEEVPGTPGAVKLGAVYPNPTTRAVTVPLVLGKAADVRVAVVDLLGREVARLAEGTRGAGTHSLTFETAGWPAGVYVVRATDGATIATRRVTVAQ